MSYLATFWDLGLGWEEYRASLAVKRDIWRANEAGFELDETSKRRLASLPGPRKVLVLTEDWCGDAARSVPGIARALALAPGVEHRYLSSGDHPEAIEPYRTHGGRSIPMAIVWDGNDRELGAWGPRPAPLQALFRARRAELGAPTPETMGEFYAPILAWYAKDRGVTLIRELLMLLERGGEPR